MQRAPAASVLGLRRRLPWGALAAPPPPSSSRPRSKHLPERAQNTPSDGSGGGPEGLDARVALAVWGHALAAGRAPAPPPPAVHVVQGWPPELTAVDAEEAAGLAPSAVDNTAVALLLQRALMTRAAARAGAQAVALSGAYLPSQVRQLRQLAAKNGLYSAALVSPAAATLHLVVSREPHPVEEEPPAAAAAGGAAGAGDGEPQPRRRGRPRKPRGWEQLLAAGLGQRDLQHLPEAWLAEAEAREQDLARQLRLFDAATWTATLQATLLSKRSRRSVLAVRSLMGARALAAARSLVQRNGLYWAELPLAEAEGRAPPQGRGAGGGGGDGGSSSSSGSGGGSGEPVVVLVSAVELAPAVVQRMLPLQEVLYTDSGGGGGRNADGDGDAEGRGSGWLAGALRGIIGAGSQGAR